MLKEVHSEKLHAETIQYIKERIDKVDRKIDSLDSKVEKFMIKLYEIDKKQEVEQTKLKNNIWITRGTVGTLITMAIYIIVGIIIK